MSNFNFLHRYLELNALTEAPRNYHIWSAFVAIAAAVHKKFYVPLGRLKIYPNLYVGLIGTQGSRKTTAMGVAKDIFTEAFPEYPIMASVQSREDIIRYMSEDNNKIVFTGPDQREMTVRPIVGFINELQNFFSVDPAKSVQFFTDIFDEKRFKSGSIKRGLEDLINPCVNLLACATPDWVIDKMKADIIAGGWARRIIYVYEVERGDPVPFPDWPANHAVMIESLASHLRYLSNLPAQAFEWDKDAADFYADWYSQMFKNPPEDKMMAGFYESKHIQVAKVAAILAMCEYPVTFRITLDGFIRALACLDVLESNMPKLFAAAGKNAMSVPIQEALAMLNQAGGSIPEKSFRKLLGKNLNPMEIDQLVRYLRSIDEIVEMEFPLPPPHQDTKKRYVVLRSQLSKFIKKSEPAGEKKPNEPETKPEPGGN